MADNSVFITGAADGAFESALGDLPPWASEKTAENIQDILGKSLDIQHKTLAQIVKTAMSGGTALTPADAQKINVELKAWLKNLKDGNAQDPKRRKRNKDEEDESGKRKKRWNKDKDIFDSKIFIDAALIKAGLAIKATFEDNVKTFNALTESGLNVISGFAGQLDGFQSLRQLTAETGVRFTELAASMQKYSSAVNSFGVGKFAKTVGMASANLTKFGFSSKESADLLGSYLNIQQQTSDVNKKTSDETVEGLHKFGANIFKLSQATGISRTAIIANAEAISKSTEANLLAGQIGGTAAEGMSTFLASFKNQDIARQIMKLLTDPIKPLNETFMNLQKVGMGGFAQSFTTFSAGLKGMPAEMQEQQMKEYIKAHRGELEAEKQRLALLKQAGVEGAAASLDFIVGITQQADAIKFLNKADMDRLMASNKASKDLSTAWEKLKSLMQRAFGPTATMLGVFTKVLNAIIIPIEFVIDTLDWLGKALGTVFHSIFHPLDALRSATTSLADTFESVKKIIMDPFKALGDGIKWFGENFKGVMEMIQHPVDSFMKGFNKLDETLSKGVDLTAWIGLAGIAYALSQSFKLFGTTLPNIVKGLFGIKDTTKGVAKAGASTLSERASTPGSPASKGPGTLSKMGKGIGDLGKGIGKGLGGLLKNTLTGLADGLKALGNTKVLKGVLALAGIAGALWLTGKAIKEFIGLKWDDLGKAGAALLGLSVAGRIIGNAGPRIIKGAMALGTMGASLWVIGKSLKEFIGLKWDDLGKAGAALLGLSVAGRIIGSAGPRIIKGAMALGTMGASLWVIGKSLKEFIGLKWDDLGKAGAALLGLSAVGRIIGNAGPQMIKGAVGLAAMGASLWVIGKSLKEFIGLKWDDLGKAGAAIVGLGVAGIIIGSAGPQMIKGAVGLVAMGASLWVIGKSLKEFIGLKWDDLGKAGAAIVGLGVAGITAGKFAGTISLGALSLGLMAGSLWITGKALTTFASIKWDDVGKATVALVGLGLAGAAAGAVAPLMALGALALGAMGAALWVIGKAVSAVGSGVETLAKGFKAFGEINGKNLLDVALGITALGGALIAFSAGSAIGAIGGVFATLGSGLSKLFGDGSALDQIKAFAAVGPGLQTTASSLSIITSSLSTLSSTLSSFAGLDTLKSIVQTVNGIDITKALTFGALSKLGTVSLPTPSPSPAGASPLTTPKSSTLNSPSQVTTKDAGSPQSVPKDPSKPLGAGKEKEAPESSINTSLSYQSSVLEQILLSTNNLVSVNKDILKYVRVQT